MRLGNLREIEDRVSKKQKQNGSISAGVRVFAALFCGRVNKLGLCENGLVGYCGVCACELMLGTRVWLHRALPNTHLSS